MSIKIRSSESLDFSLFELFYDFSQPSPTIESSLSYPNRNIAAYTTIYDHIPTFIIPVDTYSHEHKYSVQLDVLFCTVHI